MTKSLTNLQVDEKLTEIGSSISRISDYKSANNTCKWLCNICKMKFKTSFGNIYHKKSKCPFCSNHNANLNSKKIDIFIKNRGIKRLSEYEKTTKKIKWMCLKCENVWFSNVRQVMPRNIKTKPTGCPKCAKNSQLDNEIIDKRLEKRNIKRLDAYPGKCREKIKWMCLKCENVWHASTENVCNLRKPTDCPKCFKFSIKHEDKTHEIIKKLINTDIIRDFSIKNKILDDKGNIVRNRITVDFHFVINNQPIFIEYNGPHHYIPVRYWNWTIEESQKRLESQKIRDQWLRLYCNDNNIILIEVDSRIYNTEKEIETFLVSELEKILALP